MAFNKLTCVVSVHGVSQRYLGPVTTSPSPSFPVSLSIIRGCGVLQLCDTIPPIISYYVKHYLLHYYQIKPWYRTFWSIGLELWNVWGQVKKIR